MRFFICLLKRPGGVQPRFVASSHELGRQVGLASLSGSVIALASVGEGSLMSVEKTVLVSVALQIPLSYTPRTL